MMDMNGHLHTPGKKPLGGWVGLRASLDVVTKRKIPAPTENQIMVILHIASHYCPAHIFIRPIIIILPSFMDRFMCLCQLLSNVMRQHLYLCSWYFKMYF